MNSPLTFKDYLRKSLILYVLAVIGLMLLLFAIFIMFNFHYSAMKKNKGCNSMVSYFVEKEYKKYYQNIQSISQDKKLERLLLEGKDIQGVNKILYNFTNNQDIKSNFILLDQNEEIVATNLYSPNQVIFSVNRVIKDTITRLNSYPDSPYISASRVQYDNGQKSVLLFANVIKKHDEIIGYLFFDWQEASIDDFMRNKSADIIVLTDRFDNAVFSSDRAIIDSMGKCKLDYLEPSKVMIYKRPYNVVENFFEDYNLKVITMVSTAMKEQLLALGNLFLLGVGFLLIIILLIFADKATNKNLRSMDALLYAVKQCKKGNIDYRIESKTFDEFEMLYDEFNSMMIQIQTLLKNNTELAERKRWMEVKHLEEQFNPHFVFNLLETLRYEILIDAPKASEMVIALANLMRYSIHYGSTEVELQTDIAYVKDYLMLQKMRYNKRLEYSIELEEALLDYKIPKLLIQPIVENSVVHGTENTKYLTVIITIRRIEDHIELCVKDNGQGMEKEKLEALMQTLNDENAMPKRVGLYNVHRAMKLLYGEEYGLIIQSTYGEGTKVNLRIPIVEG